MANIQYKWKVLVQHWWYCAMKINKQSLRLNLRLYFYLIFLLITYHLCEFEYGLAWTNHKRFLIVKLLRFYILKSFASWSEYVISISILVDSFADPILIISIILEPMFLAQHIIHRIYISNWTKVIICSWSKESWHHVRRYGRCGYWRQWFCHCFLHWACKN